MMVTEGKCLTATCNPAFLLLGTLKLCWRKLSLLAFSLPLKATTFQFLPMTPLTWQKLTNHWREGMKGKVISEWEKNCLCGYKGLQKQSCEPSLSLVLKIVLPASFGEGNRNMEERDDWIYHLLYELLGLYSTQCSQTTKAFCCLLSQAHWSLLT